MEGTSLTAAAEAAAVEGRGTEADGASCEGVEWVASHGGACVDLTSAAPSTTTEAEAARFSIFCGCRNMLAKQQRMA